MPTKERNECLAPYFSQRHSPYSTIFAALYAADKSANRQLDSLTACAPKILHRPNTRWGQFTFSSKRRHTIWGFRRSLFGSVLRLGVAQPQLWELCDLRGLSGFCELPQAQLFAHIG